MAEVAGEVKLLLTVDGTTWSAAIDRAQREIDKLKGKTTEAAHVTRAEMTEARHAIHLVGSEIGVELPRAVQGFLAKMPGVASVMASAFSGAAIVAIGMTIVETGKKIFEFIEKQKKAAEEARRATDQLVEGRRLANLELEASTAKIEEQIAKLEKKPGDGLKVALAEARVEAFKLGQALQTDIEKLHELIESKLSASLMQRALLGAAGSEGTLEKLDEYGRELEHIAKITDPAKRTAAMKEATGHRLEELHEEIEARTRLQELEKQSADTHSATPFSGAQLDELLALRKRFSGGSDATNQTKALASLKAFHEMVQEQYDFAADTEEHMNAQTHLDRLKGEKDRQDLAKEAAEALKRETAERMATYETDLANQKTVHQMSLEEERQFWQKRFMTGTELAAPINAMIARRIAPLTQEIFKKQASDAKEWVGMMTELQKESDRAAAQDNPFALDRAQMRNQGETESARMAALHERPELIRQINAAQEELNASEAVSGGLMESRTAEIVKQRNAVARLQNELAELQGKQAAVASMPASLYSATMNPEALANQVMSKRAEIDAAEQTLRYEMERDTFGSDMQEMFREWIKRATDLREAMKSLFDQSMGSINSAIVKTLTDPYHRGDWKAAGKSIFGSMAGAGLTMGEGALMKMLGLGKLGKLGATKETAIWTRSADVASAAGGSVVNSVFSSASAGTASSMAGSMLGKVASALITAIPFMATGGALSAGMPAIVGERGPELFIPSGSGRIVPNDRWGGNSHTWNIDARGANDPVAVRFQVQRAIAEAAPKIAAGSIAASRDLSSRKPLMNR